MSAVSWLNGTGEQALRFGGRMLWQSSVLMLVILALDLGLRKRLRPAVRYALWCLVLVKLALPPSLALPTGIRWWVQRPAPPALPHEAPALAVSSELVVPAEVPLNHTPRLSFRSVPEISWSGLGLLATTGIGLGLLGWVMFRWRRTAREARRGAPAPETLSQLVRQAQGAAGVSQRVPVRLTDQPISPAVFGLFRPVILLPRGLAERLSPPQLRAVLLHELTHLKRGDVWVHCAQTMLQIVYWWHPLLWLANARIRRLREEAVDDAVMLSLTTEAEEYAPALIEVARFAVGQPSPRLALLGILEPRSALGQRLKRLADYRPPRHAGLTVISALCVMGLGALAVPMGEAPVSSPTVLVRAPAPENSWPDPRFSGYANVILEPQFYLADEASLGAALPSLLDSGPPLVVASNRVAELESWLRQAGAKPHSESGCLSFQKFSGGAFHWSIGGCTNNTVRFLTRNTPGKTVVYGADAHLIADHPDWVALDFTVVPWSQTDGVDCQMVLVPANGAAITNEAEVTIPAGGGLAWATLVDPASRKYELVLLRQEEPPTTRDEANAPLPASTARQGRPAAAPAIAITNSTSGLVPPRAKVVELPPESGRPTADARPTERDSFSAGELVSADSDPGDLPPPLYTRIITLDPEKFAAEYRRLTGEAAENPPSFPQLRRLFEGMNLDLRPPKSIFYKDRLGLLMLRATLEEIQRLESALGASQPGSQPHVRLAIQMLQVSEPIALQAWDQLLPAKAAPGQPPIPRAAIIEPGEAPRQLAQWRALDGVLQFQSTTITTSSGNQVEFPGPNLFLDAPEPYTWSPSAFVSGPRFAPSGYFPPMPGPDHGVKVAACPVNSGTSLLLIVKAWGRELLGFDDPGTFAPQGAAADSGPSPVDAWTGTNSMAVVTAAPRAHLRLPHLRRRDYTTAPVMLHDGQTFVLGCFPTEQFNATKAIQVPVFGGDVPLVGRLFRAEPDPKLQTAIILFITPTIPAPAGER